MPGARPGRQNWNSESTNDGTTPVAAAETDITRCQARGKVRLVEDTVSIGQVELRLRRPADPEALLDEEAFADDEFLPFWAELWPAGLALARALPAELGGVRTVELGCGLGVPSLVAAARGARVTAVDWAREAIELLRENADRNRLPLRAVHADWRRFEGRYDLALAADVLYEARNVEPLAELLPRLAPDALVGLAGRPHEAAFLDRVDHEEIAPRIVRVTRARPPARGQGVSRSPTGTTTATGHDAHPA
jgi:predicted nicotinamide N-methyase